MFPSKPFLPVIGLLSALSFTPAANADSLSFRFVERAPPPARVEVVPVAPGTGYGWVRGHYAWRAHQWMWIPGHYIRGVVPVTPALVREAPPTAPGLGYYWVRGHYIWGTTHWLWHRGHWER